MSDQVSVTATQLNGRSYPSTAAPIIDKLNQGQVVPVLYEHQRQPFTKLENWLCVMTPQIRCWIAAYWTTPYFPFLGRVWPTDYRKITQHYGARKEYYRKFGLVDGHEGTDFRAPTGTPVYAIDHGRVKSTYLNPKPKNRGGHNYGLHIRIAHSDAYESISAHLDTIYVRPGELVRPAQMIGRAGNTGNSFGAHLHLTIKHHGRYTNPEPILQNAPLAKDYP